jgi:hypothetical protein
MHAADPMMAAQTSTLVTVTEVSVLVSTPPS